MCPHASNGVASNTPVDRSQMVGIENTRVGRPASAVNGVNGVNGVVNGVNGLNGHSASNGNMNGHSHGHTGQNGMTNGHAKRPSVPEAVFAKNLLLKPKVLLRSVEEILWPQT